MPECKCCRFYRKQQNVLGGSGQVVQNTEQIMWKMLRVLNKLYVKMFRALNIFTYICISI